MSREYRPKLVDVVLSHSGKELEPGRVSQSRWPTPAPAEADESLCPEVVGHGGR